MAQGYTCTVNQAGATVQSSVTPLPVILFLLTDAAGTFSNTWFFAANVAKREMLATALAAIATQSQVNIFLDPPDGSGNPTQCYGIYVIAS
jgi:hypothetical protein